MRSPLKTIALVISLAALAGCAGDFASSEGSKEFHSIIRAYADQYKDTVLCEQFIEALEAHPSIADEVWFFCDGWEPSEYEADVARFVAVAAKLRSLGIEVSIQDISTGHPDEQLAPGDRDIRGYRAAVTFDGSVLNSQSCPRDEDLRRDLAERYRIFCGAVKPRCVMVDDDLRISWHMPSNEICFCEECIAGFNSRYGYKYTRESLWRALCKNHKGLREQWISYSREGLSEIASIIADAVHEVSPESVIGFQNVNFHNVLLEGYDWNHIFGALAGESGTTASRPGHGYYYDQVPADLLSKAYGISRQIARLDPSLNYLYISPEIEGYRHKMTGKSAATICLETLLYLSMGADAMSYALIGENNEPMEWYSASYFDALEADHKLFHKYVSRCGTSVGVGIDEYISPRHVFRDEEAGEEPGSFRETDAGGVCAVLGTLGVPFTPEGGLSTATLLSEEALKGMSPEEINELGSKTGIVMDTPAFVRALSKGLTVCRCEEETEGFKGYMTEGGKRVAVIDGEFSYDINGEERFELLGAFDWASEGRMAVVSRSRHLGVIVPRGTPAGDGFSLTGVTYVNTTVTDETDVVLCLRGVPEGACLRWETAEGSKRLRARREGSDVTVTIPFVKAWSAGFISID
ncbi:MAG: hypothetical protein MJY56_07535 [Bacteroidales bacterium]|nr:hypothetical protein [Bacteroidales bacterium]